ncbi:MAG: YchJ family protein [Microbacterium sp.]
MSFGRAASRGGSARTVDSASPCPCGSGDQFGACCGPVLRGTPAPTAERLMRSRYTAFFVGDIDHLIASWHPRTRPRDLGIDPLVRWTGLSVDAVEEGGADDTQGVVEFTASWEESSGPDVTAGALHERSRFVRQSGRWWYVEGDVG